MSDSQRAARMLKDWPANLYRMIDILAKGQALETVHGGAILRRFASTAFAQVLRTVTEPKDVSAMLAVLANYVRGDARAAKKQLTVAVKEAKTSKRPTQSAPKRRRGVTANLGVLGMGAAAARLGVPVSLLRYLRKHGHFEVRQAATWSSSFSLEDIDRFEKKVADLPIEERKGETVTMRQLLRRSLRGDGKGILAAEILNGRIRAVARQGPLFGDLLLLDEEADIRRRSLKRETYGGTLSCAEAGAFIGFNPTAVVALCRMGLIRSYRCVIGYRVYPGAAEEFFENYVGMMEVAIAGRSGARWAISAAEDVGVEIFRDETRPTRHVFIKRIDMPLVVKQLLQKYHHRKATADGPST